MARHADPQEQKTVDYWKQQPKYDAVKRPCCFSCNTFGHYASDCPKKKETQDTKKSPKLENISLVMPISPREETELVKPEVMGRVVTSGKIASQVVDQINLNPGADRTIVKSSFVSEEMKTMMMKGYTGNVSAYPLAEVELEVGDQKTILTVAWQGELNYDVLLGADFPHIWELGRQLLYA